MLTDVNDNKPVFQNNEHFASANHYAGSVSENATIGTTVLMVYALDADTGANGDVTYAILGQGIASHLYIAYVSMLIQEPCSPSMQLLDSSVLLAHSTLRTSLKLTSLW